MEQAALAAPAAERSARLLAWARALEATDTDRALEVARQARAAAATVRDELLADACVSTLLRTRGQHADAITLAQAGLARAGGDEVARAELLLAASRAQWSLGDYPPALAGFQQAVGVAEKLGDRALGARAHLGVAIVFGEMRERPKARVEIETSLRLAEEAGDRELQADALNGLANSYYNAGDRARARELHGRALALRTELGLRRATGDSLLNLGEVLRQDGDLAGALEKTQAALALYGPLGLKRYIANAHLQIAAIQRDRGDLEAALARLREGFAIAEPLGSHSFTATFHRDFARLHEARGDFRAALEAQRKFHAAFDAALGEKSRQQFAALNTRYEAERREGQIAVLRGEQARRTAELARADWQRYALGTALALGAVSLVALVGRHRLKLRAERRVAAEAERARLAAEEADRVKTRFLGIATHDIRGPLGNIVHLSEVVQAEPRAPDSPDRRVGLIAAEAQRVIGLVDDLLVVSALELGRLELRRAPCDLADVARTALAGLAWRAAAKRLTVTFPEPAPGAGQLVADAARLAQVVANLVGNAIKFTPEGRAVALALARSDDGRRVTLSVRDEGPGIRAEDRARLFAPFGRLAAQPAAGESSHGLGLSIVQEIVRLHGGTIRVEAGAGEGTVFVVEFPTDLVTDGAAT